MGYKFQFVTLAGFHSLNHGMFELARGYKDRGMAAYSELQEAEFASEAHGYSATRHQREVGTGYFDQVAQTICGGASSTTALADPPRAAQFKKQPVRPDAFATGAWLRAKREWVGFEGVTGAAHRADFSHARRR